MVDDSKYEEQKRARSRLRGRQRALRHRFLRDILRLSEPGRWHNLSQEFAEVLSQDVVLDPYWIDTDRYPLAWYNLFSALGVQVFTGPFPRVSGVQADYRMPLLAYHPSRAILLDRRPSDLFADIADIQPLCPVPILDWRTTESFGHLSAKGGLLTIRRDRYRRAEEWRVLLP